jgi:hypothetical protein
MQKEIIMYDIKRFVHVTLLTDIQIRLVGRVPRHQPLPPDWTFDGDHHPMYKLQGIALCSIDVTMSHVAVMYAAGRLLDSIREPFNASVIRAEMDALRSRDEASVPPEDYERWKEETGAMKDIDPVSPLSLLCGLNVLTVPV